MRVAGWGRLAGAEHVAVPLTDRASAAARMREHTPGLAHGLGRSYGDVALNPGGNLYLTAGLDRWIGFDPATGRLSCEAGVSLADIQRVCIPRGWALAVTPGTRFVTVGGAIANDVHGKNHHGWGNFGDHVRALTLARSDGQVIECGPDRESAWWAATVGGLGLTGLVTQAELQLRRVPGPWLDTETLPYEGLDEFFAIAQASEQAGWEYTVSWIDCLHAARLRGLFMRANHVAREGLDEPADKARAMPFTPPVSLVNPLSLRAFNAAYFHKGRLGARRSVSHYRPFFYPLDGLREWNRMYGPRGFYQYQSVVPPESARDATAAMLEAIAHSGEGSFLAVLKTFGDRRGAGMLSFPMPGTTLALDFPNRGESTVRLFERLDAIVRDARGRLYPAKDARMPRELFERGFPRHEAFRAFRDPGMRSAMSLRLMGS